MKCRKVQQWLRRDLDGVAEPSVEVAAHLERCRTCRAEAQRLKVLAEMSRNALPAADVPADFTNQVMASLVAPTADEALATAARPRVRRWLPVLAVLLIIPLLPLLPLLRARPAATGALRVERDGAWVEADRAARDDFIGLDAFAHAAIGETDVTALEPSLLRASQPLELLGGQVHVEARDPIVIQTPLAEIRLRAGSACVATLGKEKEMSFDNLKKLGPALLTVTLLAGGATVANAEGEEEAEKEKPVTVEPGKRPEASDPEITKALEEANRLLDEARAAIDLACVQQALKMQEEDIEKQLGKVRKILEQTRRELERMHPRADPLLPGQRQIVHRDPKTGDVIEVIRLDERGLPIKRRKFSEPRGEEILEEPIETDEIEERVHEVEVEPVPGVGAAVRVERLLRRARQGDRQARDELRELVKEIEAVVGTDRPPLPKQVDGRRTTVLAEQEVARLRVAIDEASERLRKDDVDLDEEIKRRARLQGRLMRLVELLDATRDQAELVELYQRRGRTKEANEAARRLQDFRTELAELLQKERMK
ncbi:MAG: hypothetical protein ACYSUM_09575 [Planctomycetota bacterium]|jgi:hypothetical protein